MRPWALVRAGGVENLLARMRATAAAATTTD